MQKQLQAFASSRVQTGGFLSQLAALPSWFCCKAVTRIAPHSLLCAPLQQLVCSLVLTRWQKLNSALKSSKYTTNKVDGSRFNKVLLLLGEECQEYIVFPNRANAAPNTVKEKRIAPCSMTVHAIYVCLYHDRTLNALDLRWPSWKTWLVGGSEQGTVEAWREKKIPNRNGILKEREKGSLKKKSLRCYCRNYIKENFCLKKGSPVKISKLWGAVCIILISCLKIPTYQNLCIFLLLFINLYSYICYIN